MKSAITYIIFSLILASGFSQTLDDSTAVIAVINKYPQLKVVDDTTKQLNEKYLGFVKIMTPATAKNVAALLRSKLPDDVKYWSGEAARGEPTYDRGIASLTAKGKAQRDAYKKKSGTAKANLKWLTETLPNWLTEVEKAAQKPSAPPTKASAQLF